VTHPDLISPDPDGRGFPPPPPAAPGSHPSYPPPQPYGPPRGGFGGHGPGQPPGSPRTGLRGWHLGAAAAVALLVGFGAGVVVGGDTTRVENLEAQVDRLEDQLSARDDEIATLGSELTMAEQDLAAAGSEEAADAAPATEPTVNESDAAEADREDGPTGQEYTARSYVFSDVQVREDFVGDFDVRVRMTNTGTAKDYVGITATLFSDGSVVGTATGLASDVAADATITMEMISLDEYAEWDAIEFQVDAEL